MSKFKYLLIPENLYIIQFDNFKIELTGREIMDNLNKYLELEQRYQESIKNQSSASG
jgi:predicted Ser/Thr protein kinase